MTKSAMDIGLASNGHPPVTWVARVSHEFDHGRHIFTSDDIDGLFIAEEDPRTAFDQLVPTIKILIKKNHLLDVDVVFGEEFRDFEIEHCCSDMPPMKDKFVVISRKAA